MSIENLLNKITNNNYKTFKKWTRNGTGGGHYNLLKVLKKLFDMLSGNESLSMINDVLKLYLPKTIPNKYLKVIICFEFYMTSINNTLILKKVFQSLSTVFNNISLERLLKVNLFFNESPFFCSRFGSSSKSNDNADL